MNNPTPMMPTSDLKTYAPTGERDQAPAREQNILRLEGITRHFTQDHQRIEILRGIDLSLVKGELVGMVGPSGAGKSTLLQIMGALDAPSSGQLWYGDQDISHASEGELAALRNRYVGFVFQFHHLLPEFSALENVMMPALLAGQTRAKAGEKAKHLLEQVGLTPRISHYPAELSGGEQQRVALARALVMNPPLVLADEPTGNLDSQTSEAMHELIFSINADLGTTFFIVTHSERLAKRMPRVLTLKDGQLVNSNP